MPGVSQIPLSTIAMQLRAWRVVQRGHLASLNSQQNKNETARVLPLNMAVSKSLDKGLGELPVESALIHYQIYRFGSCSLLPLGTIAA